MLPVLCGNCSSDGASVIDLPPVANNAIAIRLADFPELGNVGGSIVGKSAGYPNPIVVAHVDANTYVALDAICTHMRCTVAYNALNLSLDCPCHGSTYEVDGTVIGGPAPRPLTKFMVNADSANLTIMLG